MGKAKFFGSWYQGQDEVSRRRRGCTGRFGGSPIFFSQFGSQWKNIRQGQGSAFQGLGFPLAGRKRASAAEKT